MGVVVRLPLTDRLQARFAVKWIDGNFWFAFAFLQITVYEMGDEGGGDIDVAILLAFLKG